MIQSATNQSLYVNYFQEIKSRAESWGRVDMLHVAETGQFPWAG